MKSGCLWLLAGAAVLFFLTGIGIPMGVLITIWIIIRVIIKYAKKYSAQNATFSDIVENEKRGLKAFGLTVVIIIFIAVIAVIVFTMNYYQTQY
jgi:hypothetical protein